MDEGGHWVKMTNLIKACTKLSECKIKYQSDIKEAGRLNGRGAAKIEQVGGPMCYEKPQELGKK